ncbi:MAG TPA: protein-L-isoaspartate(D-aspartate) O-methyltransferase [Candidatus Xenobia bacterium]|nr:protein-L-isoaspartate(D-aspartate) O-methyltransferase [Candidatus Xenobia bacterium]
MKTVEGRDLAASRAAMVEWQLRQRGIHDPRVLRAFREVPRHEFVPPELVYQAYDDCPLPIGDGQTISQPYMVAAMTEAAELTGREKVLEVGTGSGYQAAILAQLAEHVYTIEQHPTLAASAEERLRRLGIANVTVLVGDGSLGYEAAAPYHAILVTAAAPTIPHTLTEQLAPGGRLVIPVGSRDSQELLLVRKQDGGFTRETINYCRFVPLGGRYGW